MCQQLLASLPDDERAAGAVGITTIRWTGLTAGASAAAAAANLAGTVRGYTPEPARAAGVWVFVAMLPPALAPAWRLAGQFRPSAGPAVADALRT